MSPRSKGRECQVLGCRAVAAVDVLLDGLDVPVSLRDVRDGDEIVGALRVCYADAARFGTVEDFAADEPGEHECLVVVVDVEHAAGWRLVSDLVASERLCLYPPDVEP